MICPAVIAVGGFRRFNWLLQRELVDTVMDRLNCYFFYSLGAAMRRLEALASSSPPVEMAVRSTRVRALLIQAGNVGINLKASIDASQNIIRG